MKVSGLGKLKTILQIAGLPCIAVRCNLPIIPGQCDIPDSANRLVHTVVDSGLTLLWAIS